MKIEILKILDKIDLFVNLITFNDKVLKKEQLIRILNTAKNKKLKYLSEIDSNIVHSVLNNYRSGSKQLGLF